jgi:hypothetical protein
MEGEELMRDVSVEVRVKIDEEIMDVRVSRVFCSRNPRGFSIM